MTRTYHPLTMSGSRRRRSWRALVVAAVLGGLVHPAPAQARGPAGGAAELDALGKQAYRDGKYADALAAFEGAYEADPLPKFLYNLGRCHEKLGDMARASHFFERYLETAGDAKDRKEVKALATMLWFKLKKDFSQLLVTANVDDALVQIELPSGTISGITPFSYWVPFGQHDVVVTADGRRRWTGPVVVKPKKVAKLHAELVEASAKTEAPSASPPEPVLVGPRADMRYRANRTDPGIGEGWVEPGFDDRAWTPGGYGVGYDRGKRVPGMLATLVPPGASSVYTRARFTLNDPHRVTRVWFGADVDDGAVAWLNGVEIWRSDTMKGLGAAWNARSVEKESSNGGEARIDFHDVTGPGRKALLKGENVLAVGVWNRSADSSDLVLAPSLRVDR